jgi:hypothetical protein
MQMDKQMAILTSCDQNTCIISIIDLHNIIHKKKYSKYQIFYLKEYGISAHDQD